jgi:hypothetical protein
MSLSAEFYELKTHRSTIHRSAPRQKNTATGADLTLEIPVGKRIEMDPEAVTALTTVVSDLFPEL